MKYFLNVSKEIVELNDVYVEGCIRHYIPEYSIVIPDAVLDSVDVESILSQYQLEYVFVDAASNPIDTEKYRNFSYSKPTYVLTGLYDKKSYGSFFPFWLVWAAYQSITHTPTNRNHLFSCLNGTPWEHRKLLYLYLSSKSYFKEIIFSFVNRDGYHPLSELLTLDEKSKFNNLPQRVIYPTETNPEIDLTIKHAAYQDAYINIVTETTISEHTPMLSEKVFKAILAKQMFILVASPNAIEFLRTLGFDVFDDIIDHSYDVILDTRERIFAVVKEIDRLNFIQIPNIDLRLEYNQKLLTSKSLVNFFFER